MTGGNCRRIVILAAVVLLPVRKYIRKLIENDPEALIELFVDQHLALESLSQTSQKQQSIIDLLERKIQELEKRLNEDSHNSHKPPSALTHVS